MTLIKVGLVGTGYAAKLRAETIQADPRSQLVAVAGHDPTKTASFAQAFGASALSSWTELIHQADLDLIIIATVNRDHGAIAQAALQTGKHVVVEYPLSLQVSEAETLIALATDQQKLLHVEHIELLSGIHQALAAALPEIGAPFYASYLSLNPQNPAPQKWTYQSELFGFPFMGALSRLHRLTNLFGTVASVSGQAEFSGSFGPPDSFTSCLCTAQLRFTSGLIADVVYGKGEAIWQGARSLNIHGETGGLVFDGEQAELILPQETRSLDVGSRRGLFARDTTMVLDHLTQGTELYVTPAASLYALKVADAIQQSAASGTTIDLET